MFLAGLIIPVVFWLLDSIAYFYQVKIRGIMDNIRKRLLDRNTEKIIKPTRVIEKERIVEAKLNKIVHSFFNHSMWLYFIIFLSDLILWCLYSKGVIG